MELIMHMSHDCKSSCTERCYRNDWEGEKVKGLKENKAGKKRFKEKKMKTEEKARR